MIIRKISARDKTTSSIAFARGSKVLATDTVSEIQGRIPKKNWLISHLYRACVRQNGQDKEFLLVPLADAGRNKEEYAVLHEGIKID